MGRVKPARAMLSLISNVSRSSAAKEKGPRNDVTEASLCSLDNSENPTSAQLSQES